MVPRLFWRLLGCVFTAAAITLPAGGALASRVASTAAPAPLTEAQAQQIGTDAYVNGIALLEYLRKQRQQVSVTVPTDLSDAPINELGNDRTLATPSNQVFVVPNPPAKYFWSITVYNAADYLVANPFDRYSIGEHTASLKYGPGGSLDIYLQSVRPAGHQSNWIPTPATGQFEAIMRIHGPKQPAFDGSYRYPTITNTTSASS